MFGDLNGWVGDRLRMDITDGFGVPLENDNGRKVIDFCAERRLSVSNTYFELKSLHHKYTRVNRGQERVEVMSMIHLVLVKKNMLRYVQDVRAVRGIGRGLSDYQFCTVQS